MRANSLALRLFLSATAWTVVALVVAGILLSGLYRNTVERAFDDRLTVLVRAIVSDLPPPQETVEDVPQERFPQSLREEVLFTLPLSGWYWQVTRQGEAEARYSRSLFDAKLPRLQEMSIAPDTDGLRRTYIHLSAFREDIAPRGTEDQRLRIVERIADLGAEGQYRVIVAVDTAEISQEMRAFDRAIVITFGLLGVVLLLIFMFTIRFGLSPLKRISESLAAIRSGGAGRLEGRFPEEIAPLARETNALIEANREVVERARTHVGNLAHALKTPLSVMFNEASARDDPLALKVREQVEIMRDQVTRHLERARIAARASVPGTVTEVRPVLVALARTMEKIHRDRAIAIDVEGPDTARFHGERQDLEEMVGNLVDNACKWAQSRVAIEVVGERSAPERPMLRVVVDDDGPGLGPAEREQVARRGRRLDETKPGSGLGLSIVVELAALYGGTLTLATAPIGGLRSELTLPAA